MALGGQSVSLQDLVTELLLRWKDNPALTPGELCHEYQDRPEHRALLAAVRQRVRDLQAADSVLHPTEEDGSGSPGTPLPGPVPGERTPETAASAPMAGPGSRYRPLSFHAKGGLGEVFRAEDEELHREV